MRICQKSACSFDNWYPKLKKWSLRAEFELVPDEVVEFLRADGVTVPKEAALRRQKTSNVDDVTWKDWSSDDEGDDEDELPQPSFPEFSAKLANMLKNMGGRAFVKLNWSAPTDAAWIATSSSLKCTNLEDVYLLLKGSGKISGDLEAVCSGTQPFYVVFKEWQDVHPGSEFRCFIADNELIAITQRNDSEFHEHIKQNVYQIVESLKKLVADIKCKFQLSHYTIDVIWSPETIKIVDLGVFGDQTASPGLFTWDELRDMEFVEEVSPEFRYIGEDIGIQPGNLSRHFGLPIDLTVITESKSRSIIDILQAQVAAQQIEE